MFSYNEWDFIPPAPALMFRDSRDVGRDITIENSVKIFLEYLSLLHVSWHQIPCLSYQEGTFSFVLLF